MGGCLQKRIFELGKMYLESLGTYEFTNDKWVMTGLREAKCLFGLLSNECRLCKTPTRFYSILCNAKGANETPVGKAIILPLCTEEILTSLNLLPIGDLQFGICPNGHETARIMVNFGGGDGFEGYLVHQYKDNKMIQIARPW